MLVIVMHLSKGPFAWSGQFNRIANMNFSRQKVTVTHDF